MDARKILGISNDASDEEIHRAYRAKVRKHHPDMGGDAWAFQQVQEAYEFLINPQPNPPTEPTPQPSPAPPRRRNPSHQQSSKRRTQNGGPTQRKSGTKKPKSDKRFEDRKWWQLFVGELPLQTETTVFILLNCLDIFFTHKLMKAGAVEANPIANYFFHIWNFNGMIVFKLTIVAIVCIIAQIIAFKRIKTARALLIFGTILVGCVVVYSLWLFLTRFY